MSSWISISFRIGIFMCCISIRLAIKNHIFQVQKGSIISDNEYDDDENEHNNESLTTVNPKFGRRPDCLAEEMTENRRNVRNKWNPQKDCSICGITHFQKNIGGFGGNYIRNSTEVKPYYKYPWTAILENRERERFCGGAIISEYYILTAAHCLLQERVNIKMGPEDCQDDFGNKISCYKRPSEFQVLLFTERHGKFSKHSVEEVIPHPKYDKEKNLFYDICILKLQKAVECNMFRSPICLPPSNHKIRPGIGYTVAGYNFMLNNKALSSKNLHEISFKLTSPDPCVENIQEGCTAHFTKDDYDLFYCMQGVTNSTTCDGDSGSVIFGPIGNRMHGVGIGSYMTSAFCEPKQHVAFISIPGHMTWISQVTGLKSPKSSRVDTYLHQSMSLKIS